MQNPNNIKSFFKDPSDIEMDYLSLPKWPLQIKKSLQSIRSTFQHNHSPIKALPVVPQLTLYDNPITPNIPINPLLHPHLRSKTPYCLGEDITEMGKGTRFVSIEAQHPQDYWSNARWMTQESGLQCKLIVAW